MAFRIYRYALDEYFISKLLAQIDYHKFLLHGAMANSSIKIRKIDMITLLMIQVCLNI